LRALRIIFLAIIALLALPELFLGVHSVWQGIQARGDVWSVQHSYFSDAWVLIPDLIAVGLASIAAFRPIKRNWVLFAAAAFIVLFLSATVPSWYYPPEMRARAGTMTAMQSVKNAVEDWAAEHGVYPRNAVELERALKKTGFKRASPFQRQRQPLDYEIVINADALQPASSSDRPGVLHYAVRLNGAEYWLTATTLPAPVSSNVVMLAESSSGPPWILSGKVQPPAPMRRVSPPKKNSAPKK